uniref:Ig-like domain-containing protein n=1 Tax=Clastoptera arizonana TaxID=38151 RepID=A0A1B6CGQ9_9HEMI
MSLLLVPWFLLSVLVSLTSGLRNVRARVPQAVRRGDSAILFCDFDLEGDKLYSVKWYKGRHEFYRFTPREKPAMKVFPIPGLADLEVQTNASNAKQLTLRNVTLILSGRYSCEISADAPSFHTALVTGEMDV